MGRRKTRLDIRLHHATCTDFWDVEHERRVRLQITATPFSGTKPLLPKLTWGLGDQQLNPNILLSDIPARLKVIEPDEELDPGMLLLSNE